MIVPRFTGLVNVGDVLCTREGPWIVSLGIRIGAFLVGMPTYVNHVIIVHHWDAAHNSWVGVEGRPGGVGWVDLTDRLKAPLTNANNKQPKTEAQRYLIAKAAESLLGAPYDWQAIAEDARQAAHLWRAVAVEWQGDAVPGQVVCSSFADWAYERVGLANPGGNSVTRFTTPAGWDQFIMKGQWK
jgi:hypothetical protein